MKKFSSGTLHTGLLTVQRSTVQRSTVIAGVILCATPVFAQDAIVPQAVDPDTTSTQTTTVAPPMVKNDLKLDGALLKAVSNGNVEEAMAALAAGANPNARGKDGLTALMLASQGGKTDLVQKLLDLGADPNATNKAGQTALHLATTIGATTNGAPKAKKSRFGGFSKMIGGLAAGAVTSGGMGALGHKAGFANQLLGGGSIDGLLGNNLKGLLHGGAFNLSGKSGWNAIIGTALQGDIKANGTFGLQNLLGSGQLDASGWTNLIGAVKGSNEQVFSAMSQLAGGQNAQWTQFLNAAASGDVNAVSSLMGDSRLQPLLAQATQGFSAAAGDLPMNSAKSIVQSLIDKGANAGLADSSGKTAAQLAQAREWNDVAALLQK
ncbi:MAG TPA: ankyrin repeat domain-containing protein [Abditibacteriaceae bacterium]|jgi:ankyrin repeat protein